MYALTTSESLAFILEGSEQVFAFRAKVSVDKSDITNISWHQEFSDWPSMEIRMPGSFLPSWIMAGSYWNEQGWDFIFAKKPKGLLLPVLYDVLVIETSKDRYRRIIIKMSKNKAQDIIEWWNENRII